MDTNPLSSAQWLRLLNDYAPHGLELAWRDTGQTVRLVGVHFGHEYLLVVQDDDPQKTLYLSPRTANGLTFAPWLYALGDLPQLPARENEEGDLVRPLVTLAQKLNLIRASEEVVDVQVLANHRASTRPFYLCFLVGTWEPEGQAAGHDYEVLVGAFGEIQWRDVTLDGISVEEAALKGTGNWRHLWGPFLLAAYEFLRELHVAVGPLAEQYRAYSPLTEQYHDYYHYWHLVPEQEGGQADG